MSLPYNTIESFVQNQVMKVLVDNIFNHTIVLNRFLKKAQKWRGGRNIEVPIEYGKNTNAESYSGSATLTTNETEFATKVSLPPRQYNAAIVVTGIELEENKGDAAVLDLMKYKLKNAEKSLKDLFATDFYATQSGTKLDGVGGIFAATSGTPYGGIDPADFSGWVSNGGDGKKDLSSGNLTLAILQEEFNKCKNGTDKPTLSVTTDSIWAGIEANLIEANKRYTDKQLANLGFENITFRGVPIVADDYCPDGNFYFFNENYLRFYVFPGMNFKYIPAQYPTNQDIKVSHIRWYGNLICTNLARQGLITNIGGVA